MASPIQLRRAVAEDVPVLQKLIELSVRVLQAGDYTSQQLELAIASVYGVDTQLVSDGTYLVVETKPSECAEGGDEDGSGKLPREDSLIVACGGWSKRKTLYGADHCAGRVDDLLDPAREAAKIRAFFVHPNWARRGLGTLILTACEDAAQSAGFKRLEMGATLTGVPFYLARGYAKLEHLEVPLGNGLTLPIVRMAKGL